MAEEVLAYRELNAHMSLGYLSTMLIRKEARANRSGGIPGMKVYFIQAGPDAGTLAGMLHEVAPRDWQLSTMLLVDRVLEQKAASESRLYSADYSHALRRATRRVPI